MFHLWIGSQHEQESWNNLDFSHSFPSNAGTFDVPFRSNTSPMRNTKLRLSLLIFLLLSLCLAGCGGSSGPAIEIPQDPKVATQTELESLFNQISLRLQTAKAGGQEAQQLGAQLKTVGSELAEREAASVRTELALAGRIEGRVPLGAVERELGRLDSIKRWDADVHAKITTELDQELEATKQAIAQREQNLEGTSRDDVLDRLKLLSELSALSGTGSENQARYAEERDAILREVSKEAEEAIRNEDYEKAQDLLGIVQAVNPEDERNRRQKCEVDGKVILKQFAQALETGRFTRSMSLLIEFSETDCFEEIKDGLADSAAPMAEAFGMLGQEATASKQLNLAYQRYKDSRTISTLLLGEPGTLPGITAFVKQVDESYERAFKAGEFGVAWGCLNVMIEFTQMTPKIRQHVRMTRDELSRRAIRGVTAYPFADPKTSSAKVGDAVASKVVQHIFQTIPSDVRIVERERLERILDECKRSGTCDELNTADFILEGSILDAKVETTEKSSSETRRVVTGTETVANPEYTRWSRLSDKERKKAPSPPTMLTRDITEDVEVRVTNVRKVGIIAVAYRIVEASSGDVLFTDSIQTKQTFQDEGRQGVQLGDYKQETDFVELPPDIEILSGSGGLSDKISEEIGEKLVGFLQNPEDRYAADAQRFVDEGDYVGAAEQAAYAIVLREVKSKEVGALREDLKRYAMENPPL
jgi:hypothetical protein